MAHKNLYLQLKVSSLVQVIIKNMEGGLAVIRMFASDEIEKNKKEVEETAQKRNLIWDRAYELDEGSREREELMKGDLFLLQIQMNKLIRYSYLCEIVLELLSPCPNFRHCLNRLPDCISVAEKHELDLIRQCVHLLLKIDVNKTLPI